MTQKNFISKLCKNNPKAVIVGSLGTISYDLSETSCYHRILIRGAMGCAMGVALGYALSSKKKVICLIGDGSFLMKMGSMSTIIAHKPRNLEVIIINNNKYASTGGQKTNFKYIAHHTKYFPFKIYENLR